MTQTQTTTAAAETFHFDPLTGLRSPKEAAAYQAEATAAEPAPEFNPLAGVLPEA